MAFSYACLTLQRAVIPAVLVLAALFRPVAISFVYMLMFFISPFIPVATTRNFKGHVTAYLIVLIAISTILLLCHIVLQVLIISMKLDTIFGHCGITELLLRHAGFIDFRQLNTTAACEWLAPEVLVFATSLATYFVTKKLTTAPPPAFVAVENGEGPDALNNGAENMTPARSYDGIGPDGTPKRQLPVDEATESPNFDSLVKISPLFCLAALFFAAVLRPSVPGGFYFLIFLLSGSYWATFQTLQRGFAILLRLVMIVLVVHIICIVTYQTPWIQQNLDSGSLLSRLISLEPLVTSSCATDIRIMTYEKKYKLDSFLSPIVILFTYYALALSTKNLIKPRIITKSSTNTPTFGQQLENGSQKFNRQLSLMTQTAARASKKDSWAKTQRLNVSIRREQRSIATEPTETTPLVRHSTRKPRTPLQTETNAEGRLAAGANDIQMDSISSRNQPEENSTASVLDQISYGIVSVGGFIYQNSYIFTNILMMAWSIVYHSWLTFVLLLWGNVLWMIPNQRKAMMRSSPFIVIYAELLVVAQYIYGMDLTNDELPSKVDTTGINLAQIGLMRPQENEMQPCVPLIVKTSFLLMFWVTLRQFCKEKTEKRRTSLTNETSTPLQLTAGPASSEYERADNKKTSKFLKKAGDIIKNLLVRLWIWLLVLVIFLCAITGKEMTGFRICYMALFLFFLLVFQSSSKAWVNIMYGFWLFLIFYAMSILILIYTYQFDKFDQYWSYYLNISETLQTDIGLERFKTKDLFLHLVSPTIIVILTVIQVHYFHKRFISSLKQPQTIRESPKHHDQHIVDPDMTRSSTPQNIENTTDFQQSIRDLIVAFFKKAKHKSKRMFKHLKGVFWRFLELHLIKMVYITAFVCAVSECCVLHILFVVFCLLGTISRTSVQIFLSRIISFTVTIIILTKMIYQIAYLDHNQYNVECPDTNITEPGNNAVWFGLQKASEETGGLMGLLKKYIIYMVMATLHAVVTMRQFQMRTIRGEPTYPVPKLIFPKTTRADAEHNLEGMIKYLFNYGFFKLGFEISLITLVTTIAYRRDIFAVLYAFWLVVLLSFDRTKLRKIWAIFQLFIMTSIFVQYILMVGLPPGLCLEFPWEKSTYSDSIQLWTMLPGNLHYNHVSKLIFDFVLLMMVNRQKRVFSIELFNENNPDFAGGTNKSVEHEIANMGQATFVNPRRDFLSHVRNYLDVFMNIILCGFYWVTLAVVFLAGTNITDCLALGYLVGAFVFLWQGSDFYLRPIEMILRLWRYMLAYNVANIIIKTCLQMVGCIFMETLMMNCCWLVHVFGISCSSSTNVSTKECPAITSQVVLVWDAVCFAFLIFQLRIFKSYYFCHIINDTKANTILASRGAEIIEDLRHKQIEHRQEHEREVLHKIKRKMEKIRATQQKMLRPIDKPTHFDELNDAQTVEEERVAPLARETSYSSCQGSGYNTPDDDDDNEERTHELGQEDEEENGDDTNSSCDSSAAICIIECAEFASDAQTDFADVNSLSTEEEDGRELEYPNRLGLPYVSNELTVQPPHSPSSELLTMPLDGFLDVNRISLGSAPNSELMQPLPEGSEESYAVFSPPPYESCLPPLSQQQYLLPPGALTACSLSVNVSGCSSVISSSLNAQSGGGAPRQRRQSSVNAAVSWNETVSVKCTSKHDDVNADVTEDIPVTLRQKSLHRRHLSMGNASYSMDESTMLPTGRRRYSNLSCAREESYLRATARPNSWGPVGNLYYLESLMFELSPTTLHAQSVRAGDYYMFEDMDEKFELDLIEDEVDFLDTKITDSEMKMNRRKTLIDVWKDIQSADYRRQLYVRQRSYASAPGSRIGIKFDEDMMAPVEGATHVRTSTLSEPIGFVRRSTSEYFDGKLVKPHDAAAPTTSKQAAEAKPVAGTDSPDATDKTSVRETALDTKEDDKDEDSDEDIDTNPIIRLLEGFLVSLTIRLNRFSRNYRYVNKILAEEKKTLKESRGFQRLGRTGAAALFAMMKNKLSDENEDAASSPSNTCSNNALNTTANNDSNIQTHITNQTNNTSTNTTTTNSNNEPSQTPSQPPPPQPPSPTTQHVVDIIELDTIDAKRSSKDPEPAEPHAPKPRKSEGVPEIRVMAPSLDQSLGGSGGTLSKQWSHEKVDSTNEFEFEEEFTAREHNIMIEMLISVWYAILSNTDLICYIVVFINQVVNASIISLPLPIMVFMWGTLSLPRPTKTFWVTLIAYTQAIVLIKCIFQFKLIWAGIDVMPNQPLSAANIFGVYLDSNYAICDLLLLLVLFFHRFILKSQGLWKSEYKDEIVNEGIVMRLDDTGSAGIAASQSEAASLKEKPETDDQMQVIEEPNPSRQSPVSTETGAYIRGISHLEHSKYLSSLRKFFFNLMHKTRLPSDVYALMFLCDFVNFFVLLFGFTAFGSQQSDGDGGVQTYLAENKVPVPFLIMLLVQFVLIVIDRALYLRKALIYKIIFHFSSVIGIHIWMFFVVPAVTERSFNALAPPIIFYIIKCFYLLLSSYQIKCGYPKRILGNFLTKGFSLANMISFKVYMQMPFLYELRTILDWVSTDTTMTLFDWLKMEDIFSDIYFIKCSRQMETDFPAIRAQKKALLTKMIMGGSIILIIVISIWGPLCLFALGNAVGQSNVPYEISTKIRIGPYDPIYDTNNRESIYTFNETMFSSMKEAYSQDKSALTFLTGYDATDIAAIGLAGNSPSLWSISPPDKERLLSDLKNNVTLIARFTYSLTRIAPAKDLTGMVSNEVTVPLDEKFNGREAMIKMLEGTSTSEDVTIFKILPKFIKVLNSAEMFIVHQMMPKNTVYRPLTIRMQAKLDSPNDYWWEIKEYCNDTFYTDKLSKLPLANCDSGIVMYTFNDKKFPSTFSFLTAGGIIGLYTTFVLLASRLLKSFIAGQNRKIMFEDLPYVDRVLQLCLDIYLVREALEFALEEDLFAKLLFLYRSPETMIKWTRPKEEANDDETDTESMPSRNSHRRLEHQ